MILDDKRAFKRIPCNVSIHYSATIDNRKVKGDAFTRNISLGGVYFESLYPLSIGQKLELKFISLPEEDEIFCDARVVRVDEVLAGMVKTFGVAAEFCALKNEIKKQIQNIISKK